MEEELLLGKQTLGQALWLTNVKWKPSRGSSGRPKRILSVGNPVASAFCKPLPALWVLEMVPDATIEKNFLRFLREDVLTARSWADTRRAIPNQGCRPSDTCLIWTSDSVSRLAPCSNSARHRFRRAWLRVLIIGSRTAVRQKDPPEWGQNASIQLRERSS